MPLVTLRDLSLAIGHEPLFDHIDLNIEEGERVCLVGRNGAGKSTLLRLLNGQLQADSGDIERSRELVMAMLGQEVPAELSGTIYDIVADGLGESGELLKRYHELSQNLEQDGAMDRLQRLQDELDACDGWQYTQRVEAEITRIGMDPEQRFEALSGGMKRRVLLARALVCQPNLLLLDEPTNHLDIEGIEWLEGMLKGFAGAILFVTHDRAFLQALATRIIELDRGHVSSWPGDYENYLRRKQEQLEAEQKANARFDKKLSEEETWIRQGIKARRTRNEGRVRALKALREERGQRREQQGKAQFNLQDAQRSGKIVIEVEGVNFAYEGRPIVRDFSTLIVRGDRIGIVGPNGSGKTTLLKLLLGQLEPQAGTVKLGTNVELAYFDQHRAVLDEEASVADNVAEGKDRLQIGNKTQHVLGYLQEFLFTPARARTPVKALSGGERNRLLLARLFTRPFNLLVMDEPTNDLDVETLELLEELLIQYQGTLLLVSHDREFINNVVTSTLVMEGGGRVGEYVGGYDDWLRQRDEAPADKAVMKSGQPKPGKPEDKPSKKKLGYKAQRELDALPRRIEELEQTLAALQQELSDPELYRENPDRVSGLNAEMEAAEAELEQAFSRWEELEAQQ
ncbi:MAG: ATP-binding cassette domain-containing protein [Gammaproteobacteria bacterium]|nr:ATP-binding cassette domain-containing protein [Gammaproteobacteria bacterium]